MIKILKACVRYFLSNFYFSLNDSPSKTMKNVFLVHLKTSFRFRDIHIFVFSSFFSPQPLEVDPRKILVYDVINRLSKNLITHFVWHLEKQIRCDTETLSSDRELNKEHFYGKIMQKMCTKSSPQTFFFLLNNPKQPLHARNSFKNKVFWKRIIKKALKKLTLFFLSNPVSSNGQSYQKQKWFRTSHQSLFRSLNKFRKITLFVIYYLTKFDDVM